MIERALDAGELAAERADASVGAAIDLHHRGVDAPERLKGLGGRNDGLDRCVDLGRELDLLRFQRLPVSGELRTCNNAPARHEPAGEK
ncbi:hypothetical protein [Sorangium sp. So ce363]|uniref:hypothetical protein n=1 Tax=Sorangium sp. So ce363 TaxID=3133304 RepID=UPI003F5E45FB